jgi:hypothetical protein
MTQYFADVLQCPTAGLDVPDLQAIAKNHDVNATLTMCRLTIAIGVQCERNKEIIGKIQALSDNDQHCLKKAIEQVRSFYTALRYQHAEVYANIRLWRERPPQTLHMTLAGSA